MKGLETAPCARTDKEKRAPDQKALSNYIHGFPQVTLKNMFETLVFRRLFK